MRVVRIAFAAGLAVAVSVSASFPAAAQKIIRVNPKQTRVVVHGSSRGTRVFHIQRTHGIARQSKVSRTPRVKALSSPVRVRKFRHLAGDKARHHGFGKKPGMGRVRFSAFALPEQTLFPPYYAAPRPYVQRPDMRSRIEGGRTVEQGSRFGSHIRGGRTVEQGSRYGSRIKGGRTVEGGSRWASHIAPGRTAERGSPWASHMPNWRFSGYAAPVRPRGIPYYRAKRTTRRARSPWSSYLY